MRFSVCGLLLQIVRNGLTIHLQLSVKSNCQLFIHLLNQGFIYEAAQNCYPDHEQGFAGG
jgi:hypothetical protein